MKGILLAGGSGSRLHPVTNALSKQLMPIYDKPMIFYPLSVLMLAGIREVLVITKPDDSEQFKQLLGDGSRLGIRIEYATQAQPNGLPEAFTIGSRFIGQDKVSLILGDNIFYGPHFSSILQSAARTVDGCITFGYQVPDPHRHGIGEFDKDGRLIGVEEKPENPKSNRAITGLYFFDNRVIDIARSLRPSKRGELEIVDVIQRYIDWGQAQLVDLGRGFAWLDTGTHDSMMEASRYIQVIEHKQGLRVACIEEVAMRMGYITGEACLELADIYGDSEYGQYVREVAESAL